MAAGQLERDPVGPAVRSLVLQSLDIGELSPEVRGAVREFERLGFAGLLHDPGRARDRCRDMSAAFEGVCRQQGMQAQVIRGPSPAS